MDDKYAIKDSGERTEYDTGAVRDLRKGKGRYDLLQWRTIMALAKHMEMGIEKYGERNWEKGIPIKSFWDSGERHLIEFLLGMDDENHLIAAIWNLCCMYETLRMIEEGLLPEELYDLPSKIKLEVRERNGN